jgi:predicted site-specific integrase-resolvase
MPLEINGNTYYRTSEVCRRVGISRNTLFRWVKNGIVREASKRDWRGWRLFSEEELTKIVRLNTTVKLVDQRSK